MDDGIQWRGEEMALQSKGRPKIHLLEYFSDTVEMYQCDYVIVRMSCFRI